MLTGKLEREQNNSAWVKAFESAGAWLAGVAGGARPLAAMAARARRRARARHRRRRRAVHRRAHRGQSARRAAGAREAQVAGARHGKRVDLAAVQASIGDSARFDVFQLGEAALGADVPRALRILAGLRSEGVEPTLALWSHRARDPQRLGHHAAGARARLAEAVGRARERQAPRGQAALCAARGAHLARRPHDQGPASRRRLGRNGAADRRIRRPPFSPLIGHSPEHAPLEYS